jgi:hypothetical protein
MKNSMKKIAAILSATILGAIPMAGSLTANAVDYPDEDVIFRYGDLNGDGFVTTADVNILSDKLSGNINFSQLQLQRADVNGDGYVTAEDKSMLSTYVSRLAKNKKRVYGDADNNGKVTLYDAAYIEEYIREGKHKGSINLIAADINGDGIVNRIDFNIFQDYEMKGDPDTLLIRWGDVNSDGYVNISDYMKLRRVVAEDPAVRISSAEKRRADVNYDGKIDSADVTCLWNYCGDGHF